jgi:hypothetical protein
MTDGGGQAVVECRGSRVDRMMGAAAPRVTEVDPPIVYEGAEGANSRISWGKSSGHGLCCCVA